VLGLLTDPGGTASFDDFLGQSREIAAIGPDTIRDYLRAWLPADQYIQVVVLPR